MEAVINPPGDEVVIIDPSWVSYEPCVQLAGGTPVHCKVRETDFQVDDSFLEAITPPKTKMIVCNSPSNPSGAVMNDASLRLIADAAIDNDCYVLSDEIYEKLIYGKTHVSIGSFDNMADRTITVNGFSKAYAMTGWRIGYAAAPEPVAKQMIRVQQHTISHPATFAMHGAVAALTGGDQQCVEAMRCEFDTRRQYIIGALHEMGYETAPAEGAFYAYVKTGGGDDMAVSARWLAEAHVAVTPAPPLAPPPDGPSLLRSIPRPAERGDATHRCSLRLIPFLVAVMTFDLHRVLFVCTYNSVRSPPMAAAILNAIAGERYTAESAGLFPSPVDSGVVAVMREKGIDLSSHQPPRSLGACSETATAPSSFSLLRCGSVPTTSLPQKRLTS